MMEASRNPENTLRGVLRIHELTSRVFGNRRKLRVWVPPGYDDPGAAGRRYPVFYLNDGQNLFDPETAFAGVDWQVDEAAESLIAEGAIPPLIVVGIDNTGRDRIKEFLPYKSLHPAVPRPLGKKYPEFLTKEVMPFIERTYRIARGANNTGLGGSSLGAVISLYTAIAKPEVFGRLLLESPSLYVSNKQLIKESRNVRMWPERVYVGIGTRESGNAGRDRRLVEDVYALELALQRAGLKSDRLRVVIDEGAGHSEGAWAGRFPEALRFLFAGGRSVGRK